MIDKIRYDHHCRPAECRQIHPDSTRLVGEKIAIVSNKPQTTRNRICGVLNRGDTQFVFMDTPGFHKPRTRLGDYMVDVVT